MTKATKQVVLTTTLRTTAPVVENRLVTFAGKQAASGEAVLGSAVYDADAGDLLAVDVLGIVLVEAGGEVAVGAEVGADAQGCAVSGADRAVGVALSAAAGAGEVIRVLLRG